MVLLNFNIDLNLFSFFHTGTKVPDSKKKAAPAYSFGQRHKSASDTFGPGPAPYDIRGLGAKGKDTPPALSLQSRPKAKKEMVTPAPGEYNINTADKLINESAPKYTFGLKTQTDKNTGTPGRLNNRRRT